tara:strand:- start:1141 stop:1659 length:519 start_codon:yes stop_codon:yes gene_type:complete
MNWVRFGKFGKTHGLKGALKFYSVIDNLEVCCRIYRARIVSANGGELEDEVESVRGHRSPFILKLKGLNSIEEAMPFCGREVLALREEFGYPEEGKHFWFDINGLAAYDEDGKYYGRVEEILETGSNDVYVVRDGKRELLLPAIEWVIREIDLKKNRLVFRVVKGLLEANAF